VGPEHSHPVLSLEETRSLEARLFAGDPDAEWTAVRAAGRAVAAAALNDLEEIGGFPVEGGRVLVIAGKGNNAADALVAARTVLDSRPTARADVAFAFGERSLRPQALRAWRDLAQAAAGRAAAFAGPDGAPAYDLCLDGLFGWRFRPPLDGPAAGVLRSVGGLSVRLRAAVDLPSGLGEPGAFRADFTYATGAVKAPLLDCPNAGRLRYLDLGFFGGEGAFPGARDRVLLPGILDVLGRLRPAGGDKRAFGHLCLVGGSRDTPGAVLMAALAALRSGVGLVTACVPDSLVPAFAARAPGAMWVGCPTGPDGGLVPGALERIEDHLARATALAIGPGLGRGAGALALAAALARRAAAPLVLDADALRPDIVGEGRAPRILTPHAGEFARIAGGRDLRGYCAASPATVALKGPVTRVAWGGDGIVRHSLFGGPVLSRGGSGDLLAGLIGGLLAQSPGDPAAAACRGVVWHGMAADRLARARGQAAVEITQLLDFLPDVLRNPG
jgi:NAD(P)H-hydrate epimerase